MNPLRQALLALLLLAPTALAGPPRPSRADLEAQAARCRRLLKSSVLDFYLPACVDRANGGYLEALNEPRRHPANAQSDTSSRRSSRHFPPPARSNPFSPTLGTGPSYAPLQCHRQDALAQPDRRARRAARATVARGRVLW
jgi:hypothetical protein